MRIVVLWSAPSEEGLPVCAEPWPFAWDPMDIALFSGPLEDAANEYFGEEGIGTLFDDSETVAILRELRRHYREDVPLFPADSCNPYLTNGELLFHHDGLLFTVLSRDALPFEEADGGVPFPP